jgi:methylenetetrahydrofolate dehydrogenase (NADP+)/methenyltetrahydrofolate cyclohydrolase
MSQKGPAGNATVTVAHSRTQNLTSLTKNADIIVMALGIPEYLTAEMIKEGATIIDVGITRVADENHPKGYVIKGDVAYDEVAAKAAAITPVPGGVGPMTIAMLLKNTLLAFQRKN